MPLNALERSSVDAYRKGTSRLLNDPSSLTQNDWVQFGFEVLLATGKIARGNRFCSRDKTVQFKADGSPVTIYESEIEVLVRKRLSKFSPETTFVGEESGGILPAKGFALAIDPIDGTWSFIERTETCSTSLALFRDGQPVLGMVMNPITGEIGYASQGSAARVIQLSLFGEEDTACTLPFRRATPKSILVNLHPHENSCFVANSLFEAWSEKKIQMLKLPGGSPAWAFLEAAKGGFNYINLWTKRPADPFDLAAGVLLVRQAGGDVTDFNGQPINALNHKGPFIAGVNKDSCKKILELVGKNLS